ncbi:MAG: hypothetical protein KBD12_01785 [Candidatus Pacebacteria bacterium]|nr:hypothetical protein [Candidatus Paceibacterota bacterium]
MSKKKVLDFFILCPFNKKISITISSLNIDKKISIICEKCLGCRKEFEFKISKEKFDAKIQKIIKRGSDTKVNYWNEKSLQNSRISL